MMKSDTLRLSERLKRLGKADLDVPSRTAAIGLCVLVGIVAGVWLLRPGGPQTSEAQGLAAKVRNGHLQDRGRPVHPKKDLPLVPGRHDRIHRDFFKLSMDAVPPVGTEEIAVPGEKTGAFSGLPSREVSSPALQLKAIMVGIRPQALINNVIVSVGEKVKLMTEASNDDVFDVIAIDDQTVTLSREETVIVLRLEPEEEGLTRETGLSQ